MPGPMRGGNAPVQKAKNVRGSLLKLLKFCKRYLPAIIVALVIAVISAVFSTIGPKYVGEMGDLIGAAVPKLNETAGWNIPAAIDYSRILEIAFFLVTIYSIGAVFSYVQGFIMATVTQKVTKSLRKNISHKINKLPLRYFDNTTFGDVLSRVTNDVDTIGMSLNQSVIPLVTNVAMLVGVLIMMFSINWIMAFTAIAASLIGFVLMIIIMKK